MAKADRKEINLRLLDLNYLMGKRDFLCQTWCQKTGRSYSVYQVLDKLLRESGGVAPSELADDLFIPRQTMTGILDGLENLGFVVRCQHATDRRKKFIKLSEEGKVYAEETLSAMREREIRAYKRLTEDEQKILNSLLSRYVSSLEKEMTDRKQIK